MKKPKDDKVYLLHINEFCEDIEMYLYEIGSFEKLKKNKLYQDAIVRKLEIIGEAANNISDKFKASFPDVPWRDIIDMRNRLIHGYFGVDLNIVWQVITKDIPPLHKQIKDILKELN